MTQTPLADLSDDDVPITVGKHRGKTPTEIAAIDPGYIVWMYEHIPGSVSRDLYRDCEERTPDPGDRNHGQGAGANFFSDYDGDGYQGRW
jgi:hypothetical protein